MISLSLVTYVVGSDVHGNLEALHSFFTYLDELNPDRVVILGDVVGYGPQPNECIEEIRRRDILVSAGNHDLAAIGESDVKKFNPFARRAIEWTKKVLSAENKFWLSAIPRIIRENDLIFLHGSLRNWASEYIFDEEQAEGSFCLLKEKALFVGHTHCPRIFIKEWGEIIRMNIPEGTGISLQYPAIINPGSIGQPRDRNPNPSFGLFDTERGKFKLFRFSYEIKKTQVLMREKKLPEYLIERLSEGK
jgi:predicted phosphodiesterase